MLYCIPSTHYHAVHLQNIGKACDLLRNIKVICEQLWVDLVKTADEKRLDLVLKMIICSHFNAKMNALIEVRATHIYFVSRQLFSATCPVFKLCCNYQTDN